MSRLFISCISDSATERDLYGLFAGFGRLASFDLKKGFGFVHYAHTADADKARRALDKYPFFGRALKVERGRNQDASPPRGVCPHLLSDLHPPLSGSASHFHLSSISSPFSKFKGR